MKDTFLIEEFPSVKLFSRDTNQGYMIEQISDEFIQIRFFIRDGDLEKYIGESFQIAIGFEEVVAKGFLNIGKALTENKKRKDILEKLK